MFKNKMCRILSLICCVMLVFGMVGTLNVSANMYFDLDSLGITSGFDFESNENAYVNRGEMAQIIVNMMNQEDVALSLIDSNYFTDIADNPYRGAINLLYEMKIISGSGNGLFEPSRNVRYAEACKMFVNALGYNKIVSGDELNNYIFMAGSIGVSDNVDSSVEYMTYKNTAIMLNNALDIGKMMPMYYNTNIAPSYEVQEGNTFRNDIVNSIKNGYVKMRGVVTADVSSYLYNQRNNMKESQIEIEGTLFDYNGVAPIGLVGAEVEFYVTKKGNEYDKIISMEITNKNVVFELTEEDVSTFTKDKLEFFVSQNRRAEVAFDNSTVFLYNNHIEKEFNPSNLNMDNSISIRTLDNDDDEIADVVFVFEYEDRIVKESYQDNYSFVLDKDYRGIRTMLLGEDDTDAYVEIYDANGNKADFSIITSGTVVSIAMSNDGYNIRLISSDKKTKGFVESKDDKYITVSGVEYIANPAVRDIKTAANVEITLNFRNRIVSYEEINTSTDYAYVYSYQAPKNGMGQTKVKLLIPATVATKTIQGTYDESTNTTSSATNLYVNNENVMVYYLASKVKVNGRSYSSDDAAALVMNNGVNYTLDKNNEIIAFEILKPLYKYAVDASTGEYITDDNGDYVVTSETVMQRMSYISNEKVFAKGVCAPFGIEEDTYAVCVPVVHNFNDTTPVLISEDELLNFKMELRNGVEQMVSAYEVDEDSHIAEFVVVYQTSTSMSVGQKGTLAADKKKVGLVTKAARSYDAQNDEESIKITMLTIGENKTVSEQTFVVSNLISGVDEFTKVSKGDFVLYSLDYFDRLNNIKILKNYNDYDSDRASGIGTDDESYCYIVKELDYDEIDSTKGRWVDVMELCGEDDRNSKLFSFNVPHNTSLAPLIFIIEGKNEGKLATMDDVRTGDRIWLYRPSTVGEIVAMIIKR